MKLSAFLSFSGAPQGKSSSVSATSRNNQGATASRHATEGSNTTPQPDVVVLSGASQVDQSSQAQNTSTQIDLLKKEISTLESQLAEKKAALSQLTPKLSAKEADQLKYQEALQEVAVGKKEALPHAKLRTLFHQTLQYDNAKGLKVLHKAGFFKLENQSHKEKLLHIHPKAPMKSIYKEKDAHLGHSELIDPEFFAQAHQVRAKHCMHTMKALGIAEESPFVIFNKHSLTHERYENLAQYISRFKKITNN